MYMKFDSLFIYFLVCFYFDKVFVSLVKYLFGVWDMNNRIN